MGLVAVFQEAAQLGAVAVDLIPEKMSNPMPSANASPTMSMAVVARWPLVRNRRSGGRPMAADLASPTAKRPRENKEACVCQIN